jgi:putative oxidoreductase
MAETLANVGRIMVGSLFVIGGLRHFFILPIITEMLRQRGVPWPRLVLLIGTVFEISAGALLVIGLLVLPAALGLILFTLAASVIAMNFWSLEGDARTAAINGWLTNVAVSGGLLLAAATKP